MLTDQEKLLRLARAKDDPAVFAYKETEALGERIDSVESNLDSIVEGIDEKFKNIELTPGPKGEDGKDGYTPIKNIDFFDGKDGKNGLDGKNGRNGIDGSTPVKNVDYFDGKDGKDGEKGERGDKPKHKWIGTKLMFEKPDGTWGNAVDLKGKDGNTYSVFGGGTNLRLKKSGVLVADTPVTTLNFAGTAVSSITNNENGQFTVTISASDIAAVWGGISGTITDQTDLVTYIGTRLADYVPYTGATGNVNLGVYNLKTSQTSLGTTAADGFILENATAATAGATVQISPRTRWNGAGWATGVNTSQTYDFAADNLPVSQATNIDGEWRLRSSRNGAAYVERFGVKTEGNDTKLKVGGVNYFGKAGNQNDFYSGTTSLRFIKNDASTIYMTISNTDGTTTLSPSTLTGSATTPALLTTQNLNTSGVPSVHRIDITRTAAGTNYAGFEIRENTGSGFNSKFKVLLNTGGTETYLSVNNTTVFGQGSGSTSFFAGSKFRFYEQTGASCYAQMDASGFWSVGDAGAGTLTIPQAAPYRWMTYGNGSKVSQLVYSAHTVPTPYYETRSARGSVGTPTATQSGDILGGLLMGGYGTSVWNNQGAAITAIANQTFTNANGGTYLKFETTPDGSVVRAVRAIISAPGLFILGPAISSSYPAFKQSGSNMLLRLGDDTGYTNMTMKTLFANENVEAKLAIKLNTVGGGLFIKEGTNATSGIATLSGGTVVVSTTKVTANSRIFLTIDGGTLTNVGTVYISARSAGTSFTISSTNVLDSSDVAWIIIEPA